jgi:hypothetical protein
MWCHFRGICLFIPDVRRTNKIEMKQKVRRMKQNKKMDMKREGKEMLIKEKNVLRDFEN